MNIRVFTSDHNSGKNGGSKWFGVFGRYKMQAAYVFASYLVAFLAYPCTIFYPSFISSPVKVRPNGKCQDMLLRLRAVMVEDMVGLERKVRYLPCLKLNL